MSDLARVDLAILLWVNGFVGRFRVLDDVIRIVSDWNFFRSVWLGLFLVWAWFRFTDRDCRIKLVSGLAGLFMAVAASRLLQLALSVHPRPFTMADELGLQVPQNLFLRWGSGNCYPSDTATLYFAFAAIIFSLSRVWGAVAFAWVAVVIAVPRVYLLYHWPSDIVAGCALGIACVAFAQNYRNSVPPFAAALSLEKLRPQLFYPLVFVLFYQIVDSFDAVEQILRHIGAIRKHGGLA